MPVSPNIEQAPKTRIVIVTPVLDDWPSFEQLAATIAAMPCLASAQLTLLAVDDGSSTVHMPPASLLSGPLEEIRVVRLKANLSHQRAIALGLAYVEKALPADIIVVMDSDGEDQPADLERLIKAHEQHPEAIIVAQRRKRSEGIRFRLGYIVYKTAFKLLTGRAISFGNFSLIPRPRLTNVIYNPSIWNSFAATLLRSRVPIQFVETDRGQRYFGQSHMNFSNLVVHGMSAISVYSDIVITRMIIFLILLGAGFAVSVAVIVALKMISDHYQIPNFFIPGYTTNLILSLANLMVSTTVIGFVGILSLLTSRVHAAALPSALAGELIERVDCVSS